LGGPDTVKGYQFRQNLGDNAFVSNAELRILPFTGENSELFQFSLGYDYGLVQNRNPDVGQQKFLSLMGYGPGVRIYYPFNVYERPMNATLRFDVGFPISPSLNSIGTRPVYYVQTAIRF
jgi:hemolysin activation/secretion protein